MVYGSMLGTGLWKVPIEGGSPVRLYDRPCGGPAISPDGKLIAFFFWSWDDPSKAGTAIVPFEGGPPINRLGAIDATWGVDSRTLTYFTSENGASKLWELPVEGGPPRLISRFDAGEILSIEWSSDRKQLLLVRGTETSDAVLFSSLN